MSPSSSSPLKFRGGALLTCLFVLSAAGSAAAFPAGASDEERQREDQVDFFERTIRPVLVEKCYRCHASTAKKVRGRLLLDSRDGMRRGGESGPAIVPGNPEASLLLKAIRYEDLEMPPQGKLPEEVIADFETWIRGGAADPRTGETASGPVDAAAARDSWPFRRPQRATSPRVRDTAWPRVRLDSFVLARLENAVLRPNPTADRRTLIRRLAFDLTGLPPSADEVEQFVRDQSPEAYERLVDRLLGSPHFGERWARLWLDVARYAEDQAHIVGKNSSLFYPNAYLYRDWVIGALNDDVPYDRFIELQLAADITEPDDSPHLAALGFLGLGPKYYNRGNPVVKADEWEDRVDTVTRGLLGLTVACARCHHHKFDPIPMEDYYALAGVFANTRMYNRPLDDKRPRDKDGQAKKPADAMHILREKKELKDLNVFIRGDVNAKGPLVPRRFLRALSAGEPEPFRTGSGRVDLARAIVDPANPLTARVFVNRIWAQLFGRGIVLTTSNFGRLGERPTHPDLLDDLAVRFMDAGWSVKGLMREIVLSSTYRQSSDVVPEKAAVDPANQLLWRMPRRRLDVESWRDALLSAGDRLVRTIGGPSVDPQDAEVRRRTVYSRVSRLDLNPMLARFDFPDPNVHAAMRSRTTTPLQKLFVLNSPFLVTQADALARRLASAPADSSEGGDRSSEDGSSEETARARIRWAYLILYGRPPSDEEVRLGVAFLKRGVAEGDVWSYYAQALLAGSEMMYID